ncbi:MAG TPA: hypothetical protein VFK05_02590 [Polyangiaceae bacterium]|nr:hypothetical protein [Polyangiaceae bacterium]
MTQRKPSPYASALVIRGDTSELGRVFEPGNVVAPFSVGTDGDWCVIASGVEAHHFYLCFDGQTLFVAAAASGAVTSIGGKRLLPHWTRLPDGGVLSFGGGSIAVTNPAERSVRRPPFPGGRADPRGPRIGDPFACETLVFTPPKRHASPAGVPPDTDEPTLMRPRNEALKALLVPSEPVEDPTIVRRPTWVSEYARQSSSARANDAALGTRMARPKNASLAKRIRPESGLLAKAIVPLVNASLAKSVVRPTDPSLAKTVAGPMSAALAKALAAPVDESLAKTLVRRVDASLAKTLAQPVTAPLAVTIGAPLPSVVPALARPEGASRSANAQAVPANAKTPLVRQCIAGLVVAASLLVGLRALSGRQRIMPAKAPSVVASAASRIATVPSGSASARPARAAEPRDPESGPPPMVNGKTPERQAVDLVARGAYTEAAALYDRLSHWSDNSVFREAARIARRKARLAR